MSDFPKFNIQSSEFKLNKRKLWKLFWAGVTLSVVGTIILVPLFNIVNINAINNLYIRFFVIGIIAKYVFDIID